MTAHAAVCGSVARYPRLATAPSDEEILAREKAKAPAYSVPRSVLREIFGRGHKHRVAEPDLVMDDPSKVRAYIDASREGGAMDAVYLYHGAQISSVIRPGDTVLDLGCGPSHLLCLVARLNPDVRFVGVDLSADALAFGRDLAKSQGLQNVTFQQADMTRLDFVHTHSIDAVVSTLALHHLPDVGALGRTFATIDRVLRPSGGLYLADLAHLKSDASVLSFAFEHAHRQPALFTLDYLYSLRAAFPHDAFRAMAMQYLSARGSFFSMWPLRYAMAVKSAPRRQLPVSLSRALGEKKDALCDYHRADVRAMSLLFRLGGLPSMLG